MRVVLDFQACQSGSKYRGIGRGSRALMLAMANELMRRGHEVICLLSEAFPDDIDVLKDDIATHVPGATISTFKIMKPCAAADPANSWRQMASRMLREHAIACLEPDFVHVPALLADGWGDDAVGSVGELGVHVPTSLTQHDLIPLVMSDIYMPDGPFKDYYLKKLDGVKQADLLLAISEYSRQEAINWLGFLPDDVIHISSAADEKFSASKPAQLDIERTKSRLGIEGEFLLYAPGGFDPRKNIDRLLQAYALLPQTMRSEFKLVIASKLYPEFRSRIEMQATALDLAANELVLTDYVTDDELIHLYTACHVYLFPSLHEGFGLPALEAMLCGAPVLASNCSCIPEVLGQDEALFDPYSPESIADKIRQVTVDNDFRERLINHAAHQPEKFSWQWSARVAVDAIEHKYQTLIENGWCKVPFQNLPDSDQLLEKLKMFQLGPVLDEADELMLRDCVSANLKASEI